MPAKVRVAMVVNNLDVGGLEKVVVSLLNHLDRERFEPYLICLDGPGKMADHIDLPAENRLVLKKNPERRLPVIGAHVDPSLFAAIRKFVKSKHIDVMHAHNLAPLLYAGVSTRLLPMWNRPAIVYSEHNQIYSASRKTKQRMRLYLKLADRIVTVSRDLQRTLINEAVAQPDKVNVLYNGIDGKRFVFQDQYRIRRELGIPDTDFVFGTAVVLSEQKGIGFLLEAAQQLLKRTGGIRFVIAGDGPKRVELESKAREMGLGTAVLFLGYRQDVPELISSFDAYVLPSLWEGLPLALIEALAIGKPIVCTSVGGNPEIVEDGLNGFVVPPRDSTALAQGLLRLFQDRAFVQAVRERNVSKFRQMFSLESMLGAHEQMFEKLAG